MSVQNPKTVAAEVPPPSCVGWLDSPIALGVTLAAFFIFRLSPELSHGELAFVLMVFNALAVGFLEWRRAEWRTTARPADEEGWPEIIERAGIKYLGLVLTISVILFFYWLFPEYRRAYYNPFFEVMRLFLPVFAPVAAFYMIWVEKRIPQKNDALWQAGLLALGRIKEIDGYLLRQHILGWLVKGFFLPIMFCDLANGIPDFRFKSWDLINLPFPELYRILFDSAVTFELVFVACGYLLSCRLLNSQIRSVDNTLFGWLIAVMSYAPFLGLFYTRYLGYGRTLKWQGWLEGHPSLFVLWGSIILILMLVHLWCDSCFGVRFSNLTNRGIITNGAYRFCKHPAYVIKNLRWWMVSVPFAAGSGFEESLRLCLMLVGVNIVYTLRSYAEEKLLSQDPTYIAYAQWMDRNSWLAFMGRYVPFLSYEWRLQRWLKNGDVKIWKETPVH